MSSQNSESNAFLNGGGSSGDVDTLIVNNLVPSKPVRSNANRQLISGFTEITEVVGLDTALSTKSKIDFTEGTAPANPSVGNLRLFAKADKSLYVVDSDGNEVALGGGGVSGSQWTFDTAISGSPAAGVIRFNNVNVISADKISINILDKNNNSYRPLLEELNVGDALYLQSADLSNNKFFRVNGAADLGTYFDVDVSLQQETSAAEYSLNEILKVDMFVSGSPFDQLLNTSNNVQFNKVTVAAGSAILALKDDDGLSTPGTTDARILMLDSSDDIAASLILSTGDLSLSNENTDKMITLESGAKSLVIDELSDTTTINTTTLNTQNISINGGVTVTPAAGSKTAIQIIDDVTGIGSVNQAIYIKDTTGSIAAELEQSTGNLTLKNYVASGSVILESGTTSLTVNDDGTTISGNILPTTTASKDIGAGNKFWNTGYFERIRCNGAGSTTEPTLTLDIGNGLYMAATDKIGIVVDRSETATFDADTATFNTDINLSSGHVYKENGDAGLLIKNELGQAENYVVGSLAGAALTTGSENILIGHQAGTVMTTARFNTCVGNQAGKAIVSGLSNTLIGDDAGVLATGDQNTIVGHDCADIMTTGGSNSALGYNALPDLTTASLTTAIGHLSGANLATGSRNVLIGSDTSTFGGAATGRIAIGHGAKADTDYHCVIGSSDNGEELLCLKPGLSQTCDLGSAAAEFKDLYLSGSVIFSATPEESKSARLNGELVAEPTTISASGISTGTITCATIVPEPSVTQITFTNTIIVEQGITVPASAPPAEVDKMDIVQLKVKNATNSNCLTYSATEDRELDLNAMETVEQTATTFPDIAASNTTPDGYILSASSISPFNSFSQQPWKAFDGNLTNPNIWASDTRYVNATGVYSGGESTDGYAGEWLQVQCPTALNVSEYTITVRVDITRQIPKDFRIYGSNDGTNWTQIDEQLDQAASLAGVATKSYTLGATSADFTYFRLVANSIGISGVSGDTNTLSIANLRFTTASSCPSIGCLHITRKLAIDGAVEAKNNMDVTGSLTVGNNVSATGTLDTTGLITCPMITFPKPFFECYVENNTTATVCTTQNTWYPVVYAAGTVSAHPNTTSYTVDTSTNLGRVTYDGMMTKAAHCGVTISGYPSTNSTRIFQFAVFKNGIYLPGSTVELTTSDNSFRYSSAIHTIPTMSTGDYLELFMRCTNTSGENFVVTFSNMFGLCLPNEITAPQVLMTTMQEDDVKEPEFEIV